MYFLPTWISYTSHVTSETSETSSLNSEWGSHSETHLAEPQHYRIEGFKEGTHMGHHYAARRQSLGQRRMHFVPALDMRTIRWPRSIFFNAPLISGACLKGVLIHAFKVH